MRSTRRRMSTRVDRGELGLDGGRKERSGSRPHDIGVERVAQPQLPPATILAQHQQPAPFQAEQCLGGHELLGTVQAERLGLGDDVERAAFLVVEAFHACADEFDDAGGDTQFGRQAPAPIDPLDRPGFEARQAQLARDQRIAVGARHHRLGDLRHPSGHPGPAPRLPRWRDRRADRPRRARPGPPSTARPPGRARARRSGSSPRRTMASPWRAGGRAPRNGCRADARRRPRSSGADRRPAPSAPYGPRQSTLPSAAASAGKRWLRAPSGMPAAACVPTVLAVAYPRSVPSRRTSRAMWLFPMPPSPTSTTPPEPLSISRSARSMIRFATDERHPRRHHPPRAFEQCLLIRIAGPLGRIVPMYPRGPVHPSPDEAADPSSPVDGLSLPDYVEVCRALVRTAGGSPRHIEEVLAAHDLTPERWETGPRRMVRADPPTSAGPGRVPAAVRPAR